MVVTAKHCATSPETHVPFYYAFHTNTKRVTTGSVPFHFTSLASLSLTLHPSSVSFFSSSPFLLCSIFFFIILFFLFSFFNSHPLFSSFSTFSSFCCVPPPRFVDLPLSHCSYFYFTRNIFPPNPISLSPIPLVPHLIPT